MIRSKINRRIEKSVRRLLSITDKLIQPAFLAVEEDIVVLAVVDFELMICTVSVPCSCNDIQVVIDAVLYVLYFKPAKPAVIGNGIVMLADLFLCHGITS